MTRYLLSRSGREALAEFVRADVLLGFDFDGTLAPIVGRRNGAGMRPATRRLLRAVARRYPCIVISGRARADVMRRLGAVGVVMVVGNHGLEPGWATAELRGVIRAWRGRLRRELRGWNGVQIEDKAFSLAVHYRAAADPRGALAAIVNAAGALPGARTIGGKMVVNVLPAGVPLKGVALEEQRARCGCAAALYVGDDETDEDVFALDLPGRLLAVRVGWSRASAAPWFLRSQGEVDELLRVLVARRAAAPIAPAAPTAPTAPTGTPAPTA